MRLPALTVSSGMRYRIFFRLSCGCPPDGKLSWIASASPAGICQVVLLTVLSCTNVQKLPDQSPGSSTPWREIAGGRSGACGNEGGVRPERSSPKPVFTSGRVWNVNLFPQGGDCAQVVRGGCRWADAGTAFDARRAHPERQRQSPLHAVSGYGRPCRGHQRRPR